VEQRFSEFSYGFAVTSELVNGVSGNIYGRPIFPTLREEGNVDGGYDVKLPSTGYPLYLQFKRVHYMQRRSAENWELFNSPHYRMYLMPSSYSIQQELLIHLELSGNEVYYIAPEFFKDNDLTEYYTNQTVFYHSVFFRPSDIGHLPDDFPHYVAFNQSTLGYFCSAKPRKLETILRGEKFYQSYNIAQLGKLKRINKEFYNGIINNMMDILERNEVETTLLRKSREHGRTDETIGDQARFAAFLARAYFDVELFIVGAPASRIN
jgi:hypothetical protein